jgi:hypothetical protein
MITKFLTNTTLQSLIGKPTSLSTSQDVNLKMRTFERISSEGDERTLLKQLMVENNLSILHRIFSGRDE